MATFQTTEFLHNFNLKESKCCGKIFMFENSQLIFYCQICTSGNFYTEFDELLQHYIDAHEYNHDVRMSCAANSEDEVDYQDEYNEIFCNDDQQSEPQSEVDISDNVLEAGVHLGIETLSSNVDSDEQDIQHEMLEGTTNECETIEYEIVAHMSSETESTTNEVIEESQLTQEPIDQNLKTEKELQITQHQQHPIIDQRKPLSSDYLPTTRLSLKNVQISTYNTWKENEEYKKDSENSESKKGYSCEICGKSFGSRKYLYKHCKRHENEKKVQCPECPKQFRMQSELNKHLVYHRGIKSFLCSVCGKSYFTAHALKEHFRRHTNERNYACNQCSKTFFESKLLRQHEISHLNERPYKCDQCDRSFKTPFALKPHKKSHANLREHKCKLCGSAFNLKTGLLNHLTKVHRIVEKENNQQTV